MDTFKHIELKEKILLDKIRDNESDRSDCVQGYFGLAFSGGGIRSATFNLGILQALAKSELLRKVDYLSTVSGGGYIGSWLTSLIYWQRKNNKQQNKYQALLQVEDKLAEVDKDREPISIRFLREYSNYLTPKIGLFSTDTLSSVANYLRNLYLNQLMLLAALICALLIPRIIYFITKCPLISDNLGKIAIFSASIAVFISSLELSKEGVLVKNQSNSEQISKWLLPFIFLSALTISLKLTLSPPKSSEEIFSFLPNIFEGFSPFFWIGALYGLIYLVIQGVQNFTQNKKYLIFNEFKAYAPFIAGILGASLFYLLTNLIPLIGDKEHQIYFSICVGTLLSLKIFSLLIALHIGLVSRGFSEENREWWGRLGGIAIWGSIVWFAWFGIALYGPILWVWAEKYVIYLGGPSWLFSTLTGVWLAHSDRSGKNDKNPILEKALSTIPYVFIIGMLLIIACSIDFLNEGITKQGIPSSTDFRTIADQGFKLMAGEDKPLSLKPFANVFALSFALFLVLGWRIDINLFSMHHYYHNRLTRCYLGASREREPSPFTGFDPNDDIHLSSCDHRPYHLINTAINLVSGDNLAWQQRKAGSFLFSPMSCGYEFDSSDSSLNKIGGFRSTNDYMTDPSLPNTFSNGVKLGTAFAISGAAASPNMGYHSSPGLAFLMTMFNVRLGRWCGNPARKPKPGFDVFYFLTRWGREEKPGEEWKALGPSFSGKYLIKELLGMSDANSEFVYLSDGGHFENLGLYELVRRHCKLIVVCDAGSDPNMGFEDLGNAIRKCKIDFGAEVDINIEPLKLSPGTRTSNRHWQKGVITYLNGDKADLFYVKSSLTDAVPADIKQYAFEQETFPHQTTADQFFDEAQFESYRKLGEFIGEDVAGEIRKTIL